MSRKDRSERESRRERARRRAAEQSRGGAAFRDMRFDTADASEVFLNLGYLHPELRGTRDGSVLLPPVRQSVSQTASSGGMVYKAFPHGLMYGDQLSLMNGGGIFVGLLLAPVVWLGFDSGWIMFDPSRMNPLLVVVFILLTLTLLPVSLLFLAGDFIGYRFNHSALFDRRAGKVHLFSDQSLPWKPWRCTLKSYDWDCVRAQVDTVSIFSGTLARSEAGLRLLVMDQPGGQTVVDELVLGVNVPAHHIQPLLDTWEHVRRFMQHEGPLFADETDQPNPGLGRQSLWRSLMIFPALEVTSTIDLFKFGWQEKSPLTLFMACIGVILLPAMPLLALFGLPSWLSGLAKREPKWPPEILASVGGAALQGADLQAWRGVVPEQGSVQDAAKPLELKTG